ncbi:hypothetical protein BJ166DRAFT_541263 [Pestalotiopsis sp. NC0098]|nr:hypothetical protein BJ166DRAFT_541263 [Pestalotiopsis sp. NC0098]
MLTNKSDAYDQQHDTTSNQNGDSGGIGQLVDLPNDLFLLVISYLSPEDTFVCRRVCRTWQSTFSSEDVAWYLLKLHFPRSRELRFELTCSTRADRAAVYAEVAQRYHHLRAAKPRSTEKITIARQDKDSKMLHGVAPWSRFLHFNDYTAPFSHHDSVWCMADSLIVYPDTDGRYCAYDLETRNTFPVPFDAVDKTVRRIRLACGVLVFEWCEQEPYHQLNDEETVHRHFATAFDVESRAPRSSSRSPRFSVLRSETGPSDWSITFRSEWKIHFLGFPLNRVDRFFSAHTATHYALYTWQPNRSPWGEADPPEQFTVWDISFPSQYRPSTDPTGRDKPDVDLGPHVIQRLSWRDLDFLGLRQRDTPSLRQILLDEHNVYVHEEEHRWLAGPQSSLVPPRHHLVRCTGFPISGIGPKWFDECCADGDVHLSFCPRSGSMARLRGGSGGDGEDSSPATTATYTKDWPGFAPCWRHEEFPYLTMSEVVDAAAGVRIVARQCFMVEALSVFILPRISVVHQAGSEDTDDADDGEVRFKDDMWGELMGKGRICGDERFIVGEDMEGKITVVRF